MTDQIQSQLCAINVELIGEGLQKDYLTSTIHWTQGQTTMASTAIVIADLIGSKQISANVGGVATIDRLREAMSQFFAFKLDEFNLNQAVLITKMESQGETFSFDSKPQI